MAQANIRAVITAQDNASHVVKSFGTNISKNNNKIAQSNRSLSDSFVPILTATAGMGLASRRLIGVITESVGAANKYQGALIGLSSIARAFGHDVDTATKAAQDLANDGLLTVADSARGLKNLLQSGFSLPQAITLMNRFKDSAAFGRQSALTFGEAIASATEGIKNGNSILVDNAGVTKNLSIILEEAGFSAQDLMRATTDASVRQALFNGIIKETNAQVGDAAKLTETFAGGQARLQAQTTILRQQIGEALQPALTKLLETVTPLIERFTAFTERHPQLVANILLAVTALTGLVAILGTVGLAMIALGPVFRGFGLAGSGSAKLVSKSFVAMKAVVTTPIAMPAIAVGAAIAALALVTREAIRATQAVNGAKRATESARTAIGGAFADIQSSTRMTQAEKDALSRKLAESLARQHGGPVASGNPYIVGEAGPELFVPKQSGTIIPNNKLASGGGTINLNVNIGMYAGTEMEKRKIAESLFRAYSDLMASKNMAWGR